MNFAVAFISDRGDLYLPRCSESLHMNLVPDGLRVVDDHDHHLGMAGAVREAWTWAVDLDVDFLFHVEEDFTFNERVDIAGMAALLDAYPRLAQIVLKRQPWNEQEHAAGGIIEANPDAYRQQAGFVEHREIFSLNPCLIPARVLELGWPDGNEAEFTQRCLDEGYTFAFYGSAFDPPRVEHIGHQRANGWRL